MPSHNDRLSQSSQCQNYMDCDKDGQEESETDVDYNDYVVTSDICPGLNMEGSSELNERTKSDKKVT